MRSGAALAVEDRPGWPVIGTGLCIQLKEVTTMVTRKQAAARARRKMREAARTGIVITDGPPPLAVMTCSRCGTQDVNEDWLVMTSSPVSISAGDTGICPPCVLVMFGARAFKDADLLSRARASHLPSVAQPGPS